MNTNTNPTQVAYPWRATVRTIFSAVLALLAAAPVIYTAVTLGDPATATGGLATALAVAAAVTRLMATPAVQSFLAAVAPWLLPAPLEKAPEVPAMSSTDLDALGVPEVPADMSGELQATDVPEADTFVVEPGVPTYAEVTEAAEAPEVVEDDGNEAG